MSRYTELMKTKVVCYVCNTIITRGHVESHLKTKKHINNINAYNNDKVNKDCEVKKSIKEV